MKFQITKYPKQIVWLDTNFVSTMVRNSDPRSTRLQDYFRQKTGEYFVVQGDNTELQLGREKVDGYSRILAQLSCGVSFIPYETIAQFQFQTVAKAFIEKQKNVELCAKDYMNGDPIMEEERTRKIGFIVSAKINSPLLNQANDNVKKKIFDRISNDRPSHPVQKQQELESETTANIFRLLKSEMEEKAKTFTKLSVEQLNDESNEEEGNYFAAHFRFVSDRLQWWRVAGGSRDYNLAFKEAYYFVCSKEFKQMPFNRLNDTLWGTMGIGSEKLKESDYWDVKHISAVLPFCHVIFTENRMRERLKQYKLDKEYETEVYSMNNIEEFFSKH